MNSDSVYDSSTSDSKVDNNTVIIPSKYDFDITPVLSSELQWILYFKYNPAKFNHYTIQQLAKRFQVFINDIFSLKVNSLNLMRLKLQSISTPLLTSELEILDNMNKSAKHDFGAPKSIPSMFYSSVEKYPNNIACRLDDSKLTYSELHSKVYNLSSHLLNNLHIKPGSYIGQCVDRSLDMLIGILSIMSIGCIYVPLNPADPIDRLSFLINDISAPIILTQSHLSDKIMKLLNKHK